MFKKKSKIFKTSLLLIGILILPLGSRLKAQPGPGFGAGSDLYIQNQLNAFQPAASYWIRNDGKFGPTDNDYIYLDPTVAGASNNNIYVKSTSTAGSFIKLQLNAQEKFKVEKTGNLTVSGDSASDYIVLDPQTTQSTENSLYVKSGSANGNFLKFDAGGQEKFKVNKSGDVYMGNLYVENIIGNQMSNELNNYQYNHLNDDYYPYFATSYKFNFPSGNKPSGSGRYIFLGANNASNQGKIYIIKADTGEVVGSFGTSIYNIAGLAVVQAPSSSGYRLYYAAASSTTDDRALSWKAISFSPSNNYEPTIPGSGGSVILPNNATPFYLTTIANYIYITDNGNHQVIKYFPSTPSNIISYSFGQYRRPYAIAVQTGASPAIWVTAFDEGEGSSGILRKFDLNLLPSDDGDYPLSGCEYPKLMAFDKYNNVWITCSDSATYYSQDTTGYSSDNVIKFTLTSSNPTMNQYQIPYHTGITPGGIYSYSANSLPYGIYYHPTFEQMIISNRKDGRVYRLTLDGQLINCDGTTPEGLSDFQACVIDDGAPLGQIFPDSSNILTLTDSYWTINMSNTNSSIYRGQSMRSLYAGDIYANGHVASFGYFVNDDGVTGKGHERFYFDTSGWNDKLDLVVYQTNVGQTGDRAALHISGDAAVSSGDGEYDLDSFTLNAEKIMLGPYFNGTALTNDKGTKNKGEIYLQGMTIMGMDSSILPSAVVLNSTENLLYGVIDNDSTGNFILLQTKSDTGYSTKFMVEHNGNTTIDTLIGGNITITDTATIYGLTTINDNLDVSGSVTIGQGGGCSVISDAGRLRYYTACVNPGVSQYRKSYLQLCGQTGLNSYSWNDIWLSPQFTDSSCGEGGGGGR